MCLYNDHLFLLYQQPRTFNNAFHAQTYYILIVCNYF